MKIYNDNEEICSICITDLYNTTETETENLDIYRLQCNHVFHTNCIFTFLRHESFYNMKMGYNYIRCKKFICPLCRQNLVDDDLKYIITKRYSEIKKEYKNIKKKLSNLQKEHMIFNYKYKFKSLFVKQYLHNVRLFLIEDDKYLKTIDKMKSIAYDLENQYTSVKSLYFSIN